MQIKAKHVFITLAILIIVYSVLITLGVCFFKMIFLERYIEHDPQKLISEIETVLEIDFPNDITDTHAGEFRGGGFQDSDIVTFLVAFSAKPDVVDGFIKSITDGELLEYQTDMRCNRPATPDWFKMQILEGRRTHGSLRLRKPAREGFLGNFNFDAYIDISNKDAYRVYLKGFYRERDVDPAILKE